MHEDTKSFARDVARAVRSVCLVGGSFNVQAQEGSTPQTPARQTETKDDETNLDTQLFLLVGSNQDVGDPNLPASLDSVVKQLRATLPFKNYRLAATLLNRVKNEGRLDLSWIGGPLASTARAGADTDSRALAISMSGRCVLCERATASKWCKCRDSILALAFRFRPARRWRRTSRCVPYGGFPTINYERNGVATDISMREGDPVIVGTLNVGPSRRCDYFGRLSETNSEVTGRRGEWEMGGVQAPLPVSPSPPHPVSSLARNALGV